VLILIQVKFSDVQGSIYVSVPPNLAIMTQAMRPLSFRDHVVSTKNFIGHQDEMKLTAFHAAR
jgi:hypothetical protein